MLEQIVSVYISTFYGVLQREQIVSIYISKFSQVLQSAQSVSFVFLALLFISSVACLVLYWSMSSQALGRQHSIGWMRYKLDSLDINIIGIKINSSAQTSNETDEAVNNESAKSCCSNQSLMFGINSSFLASSSPKTTSLLPSVLLPLQSTVFSRKTKASTITSLPSTTFTTNPTLLMTKNSQKREEMLLLCHHLSGRLGNQLFQSASVLGLSYSSNRTAVIFSSSFNGILKKPLLTPEEEQLHKNRCAEARVIGEGSCCRYEEHIVRETVQGQTDIRLGGYLQSWKYFDRFREQIKIALAFSEQIVRQATEIVQKLRAEHNFTLIGVHVRRGDYALDSSKKSGYVMATREYFHKSMTFFQKLFPNAIFVVACETTEWCKSNLLQNASTTYLETHSAAVDLSILSQLDHIIISTGTYSWWAGYLNPGMTVYFKDFIVPGTFIGKQFNEDAKDYLLPQWIPF